MDHKISMDTVQRSDEYCYNALEHWDRLRDYVKYLEVEHDLKEKEYGIKWRCAFKEAILSSVPALRAKGLIHEDKPSH